MWYSTLQTACVVFHFKYYTWLVAPHSILQMSVDDAVKACLYIMVEIDKVPSKSELTKNNVGRAHQIGIFCPIIKN